MAIISCPDCGTKNRVDEARADRMQPVCGKCGRKLDFMGGDGSAAAGHPITITDASLAADLSRAGSKPVLIDCWAAWCGPCRMIAPTIDQLAAESGGRYVVGKLDVDANPRTASQYRVSGIPALLIFKGGRLVDQIVGLQPKAAITAKLAAHL